MPARSHGHSRPRSRTYTCWANMKQRCTNDKRPQHEDYVGRGITLCERWKDFANFLEDMGECPTNMTIERVDNDRGYEPGNCVWQTLVLQQRNRRDTILTLAEAKLIKASKGSGKDVGARFGVSRSTVYEIRAGRKWPDA